MPLFRVTVPRGLRPELTCVVGWVTGLGTTSELIVAILHACHGNRRVAIVSRIFHRLAQQIVNLAQQRHVAQGLDVSDRIGFQRIQ